MPWRSQTKHTKYTTHKYPFNFFKFKYFLQIHSAIQQPGFKRVKRGFRPAVPSIHGLPYSSIKTNVDMKGVEPTDPYYPLQWYLKNTGQNGGKIRLDLNVQAAWDQGITGKNITTAIMDDGKELY